MSQVKHVSRVEAPPSPLVSVTVMTLPISFTPRSRRALVALLAVALGTAACADPFQIRASRPNISARFELWAMSGSPVAFPSGLLVPQAEVVRLDAAGSFDLAFDIATDGRLMVWPVGSVVSPIVGTRPIGFQLTAGVYDGVLEAPAKGWTNDSLLVVGVGQSFLVKVSTQYCQYDLRKDIYAKVQVDSVILSERRVILSAFVNPNCGFRSFASGVPEF